MLANRNLSVANIEQSLNRSSIPFKQATLIGGWWGILKIPPSKFWEKFSKNREKLRNLG